MMLDSTARQVVMIIEARTRGTTRNRTGLIAWERSALSSSLTAIVPISAAMEAPAKPVSTIAPTSGPSSRKNAIPMMDAIWSPAPYCSRMGTIWRERITPMAKVTSMTTPIDLTPTR